MLKPDGLGSVQLGALKEGMEEDSWGTERFDGPSRKIWDQSPSSKLHFPNLFCMVYWGSRMSGCRKSLSIFLLRVPFLLPAKFIRYFLEARRIPGQDLWAPTKSTG